MYVKLKSIAFFLCVSLTLSANLFNIANIDSVPGFNLDSCIAEMKAQNISAVDYNGYINRQKALFLTKNASPYFKTNNSNSHLLPQAMPPCTNIDFETGNFTGWTAYEGYNSNSLSPLTSVVTGLKPAPNGAFNQPPSTGCSGWGNSGNRHTIVTSALGNDAYGGFPVTSPLAGNHSVLLNNDCTGGYGSFIEQQFSVSTTNSMLTIAYAIVLEDGGHDSTSQPYFRAEVLDQNGNPIQCLAYDVVINSGGGNTGFIKSTSATCGTWCDTYYKPWTVSAFNLSAYIGQNVTVRFTVADCAFSGHYGYAYVDARCGPMSLLTSSPAVCGNKTVTITGPAGMQSYQWAVLNGQGNIIGSTTNQTLLINQGGHYQVTVTPVTGSGCAYTIDSIIPGIPISPTAQFVTDTVCFGKTTSFTDLSLPTASVTAWLWDFDNNGTNDASIQNPTYQYSVTGVQPVKLTITAGPCVIDTTIDVLVDTIPKPVISNGGTYCEGKTVALSTSGSPVYSWKGPGTFTSSDSVLIFSPGMAANSGVYSLTVTDPTGCKAIASQTLQFNVNNFATASSSPAVLCAGATISLSSSGGVTYSWTGPGGYTSTQQNPIFVNAAFSNSGTYTVVATDANGCISKASTYAQINPVPVASFTPGITCSGDPMPHTNLSTGQGNTYQWRFSDGASSTQVSPLHNYTTPGAVSTTLIATNIFGCKDTAIQNTFVHPLPTILYTSDIDSGCTDLCVNFINQSSIALNETIASYYWQFGDSLKSTSTQANPNFCYTQSGFYTVSLTAVSAYGCRDSSFIPNMIFAYPGIIADYVLAPQTATILSPLITFYNYTLDTTAYHWYFGDGTESTSILEPRHEYQNIGTYDTKLVVTNQYGCMDSLSQRVYIEGDWSFYVPNTFTPNNDTKNDKFEIESYGLKDLSYKIYNRWGEIIFEGQNITATWDGTTAGKEAKIGVYICRINYTDAFGKPHEVTTHITLLR